LEVEGRKRKKEEHEKLIDFELQRSDPGKYLRTEDPKEYLARGLGKLLLWAVWVKCTGIAISQTLMFSNLSITRTKSRFIPFLSQTL